MKKLLVFIAYEMHKELDDVNSEHLSAYFNQLDGVKNVALRLRIERKHLTLIKSNQNRFHIRFMQFNEQHLGEKGAILLSSDTISDEDIDFLLSNGQIDYIPMNETVDSETAHRVALQFWESETLLEDLNWDGVI